MMTMEKVAGVFGIGAPVLRYLFGLLASIPCSWLRRYVPGATGRHLYAAATGALLSYCSFGATSTVYFGILMLGSYLSMLMFRRHCGIITFVHAFAILLTCHMMSMRGEKSKTTGGHSIGAMMVLTLKVISAAINYQDGLIQDEDTLRNAQKNCRLQELPSPIAFIGYCLNCGTHLAGPVFEIRDYLDWTENKGLWSPTAAMQPPSAYKFALVAILKAFACMGIYMYLMNYFTIQQLSGAEYQRWGIWNRIGYQYLCAFTARWKYYIVWSLSETSMIISGFGFSGWTKASPSEEQQPKWTRAKNVDILRMELPRSAVEIPVYWNIHVGIWLRHYIYERLTRNGGKAGFMQLFATQLTSAVWHGLYPGYVVFFVNTVFMIAGGRVLYRWWKLIPEKAVVAWHLATFVNGLYAVLVINLTSIAFMLLDYAHTMAAFRSVYYIGTWIPFLVMVLGSVIKVPSTQRKQRAKKEE
ncbi:hypothetical protein CY35_02G163900 [Sphagnum magellanicum]|nr:hypothetical protein CY35_02G163900 [Sphagnum magellanicum]KAH9572670.1 hypothetical protein CY35_02G163900 [Sphagnum magellanicum]